MVEQEIGKEAKFKMNFEDGQVVLSVVYDGKGADAEFKVKLEGDYFLDKLADAIPGDLDNMVIAALKGAIK